MPNLVYGLSMHYADVVAVVIDMVIEMSLEANTSRFIKKSLYEAFMFRIR